VSRVQQVVGELAAPLRSRAALAVGLASVGGASAVLAAGAWAARLGLVVSPAWAPLAWIGVGLTGVAGVLAWRRQSGRWRPQRFAEELETRGAARRGALTALFESSVAGTSAALREAADVQQGAALAASGPVALAPITDGVGRRLRQMGALAVGAVAVFVAAGPTRGAASQLWHPLAGLADVRAPVRVEASAATVERGGVVTLVVRARGQRRVQLWLRAPGEAWRAEVLALDSSGIGTRTVGPLTDDLFAHATTAERSSDTVQVRVQLPVFLASLGVTAKYPGYLQLDDEPVPLGGDTLLLPIGTRLETRGEATGTVQDARWISGAQSAVLDVAGARFSGSFVPNASGVWRLVLGTGVGAGLAGDTIALPIRLVADAVPTIEVPVPGMDTIAPPSLEFPIVADARDDHGLVSMVVEARRISARGVRGPVVRLPMTLPAGTPDRAIVPATLRLGELGAASGDTVRFRVLARDNAPAGQVGASREFVIRLATITELRTQQRKATEQVGAALDSLAALGKKLERTTEDLSQETPRSDGTPDGATDESLSYDDARKAEAVVEQQRALQEKAEQAREAIRELQQGAEAAGLKDEGLQQKLAEIRKQLDKALSPELKQKLAQLQQSLKELDGNKTQEAMKELARAQQELREALERARELFERAALEGDLQNLAQETKDLAKEQRDVAKQADAASTEQTAAAQQELASRADSLAAALEQTAGEMPSERGEQVIKDAAKQAKQAAEQMRKAGQQAKAGKKQEAQESGEAAAEQLEPAAEKVDEEKSRQQDEWREEVMKALDRALAETSRLVERQLNVQQQLRKTPGAAARASQAAVEEGTGLLVDQLRSIAGKNALVPPGIAVALATAQKAMEQAREAVSTANANPREAADRAGDAVDALNVAAYQMIRARGNVSKSESGSGLSEAMQQMQQMAQQQGSMGQQSSGLLPQMGGSGVGEQLKQLGAQQRAMADKLEKMRGQANVPGAGAMAEEAKEIARQLEAQRLDRETVDRQERLFKRMLDAGRTLQGTEKDEQKERESTAAKAGDLRIPPDLRKRLGEDGTRLRMPSWDELQRLSPDERRLVSDYFRRLAETGAPK